MDDGRLHWVGFKCGGPSPFISVHVASNAKNRVVIWWYILQIQGPLIYQVISIWWNTSQTGIKAQVKCLNILSDTFFLVDIGGQGQCNWQNYSKRGLTRKARLDRCYISSSICNQDLRCKAKVDISTCISYHYPLVVHR